MRPYYLDAFGNASSIHHHGQHARAAVEHARESVARLVNCRAAEVVFTSGGTEGDNFALSGLLRAGDHLITSTIEHHAVLNTAEALAKRGVAVTHVPVDGRGLVDPEEVRRAIQPNTKLISIMMANNETGVLQPVAEIGRVTRERGIPFHCDAVQAVGKVPFDVEALNVDLASISAHKMYGPKGVGALYVRRKPRVRLIAEQDGGGHERGYRSGTLNVPGIVGLGKACALARELMPEEAPRLLALRERLRRGVVERIPLVSVNGSLEHRLPGNLNVSFAYVEGEALMMAVKDVAVSSGSACTSASLEPSYVLRAMGVSDELAHSSIRFGLGRFTTQEEVDYAVELFAAKVKKLRDMSPLWDAAKEAGAVTVERSEA
jgi:cysteine desulfurase